MTSLLQTFRPLHLARPALILALLALLIVTIWNNYLFFYRDLQVPDPSILNSPLKKNDKTTIYGVKDIQSWNIFGEYSGRTEAAQQDIASTTLSIKLFGTFFSAKNDLSAAIVSLNEQPPTLVKRNSNIAPRLKLKQVTAQSIIIENNGTLEKVALSDFDSVLGLVAQEGNKKLQDRKDDATEDKPKTARERALKKYGLEAVAKGSASGYRITEEAKEIIEQFGLSPGDVILSVNGYPVGENDSDTLAMKSFQGSGSASVTVNQNGTTTVIDYKR